MKYPAFNKIVIVVFSILMPVFAAQTVSAYWVWTPESKKFINPKHAVKDSPKEQFEWAMNLFDSMDYQKAAVEFEKLVKNYEYSEYASRAQYYAGLSYENLGKYYQAFQNYQKTIDNFPHVANIEEILERQFNIGNLFLIKDNPKVMGTDILSSADRAAEIFRKVVDNAPYGMLADRAQFKIGEALKIMENYEEAMEAFQKIIDNYPDSSLVDRARYEVAYCAYMASLKPAYASEPTERAIRVFEEFSENNKNNGLAKEADVTIRRLKDKAAEKIFSTAQFYEKQKRYESAIIYYQDVIDEFPESHFADLSSMRIEELKKKRKK